MRAPIPMPRLASRMPVAVPGFTMPSFLTGSSGAFIGDALADLGAGIAQGGFKSGVGIAAQRAAELQPYRAQQAQAAKTKTATMQYLETKHPDLAQLVSAGTIDPGAAISEAMKRDAPGYGLIKMGPGDQLVDPAKAQAGYSVPNPAQDLAMSKEIFDRSHALNQEYAATDPVKTYQAVRNQYERLRSSAQQNNGAGDVSMIFAYMKMLDPTSVVREGEFATAEQTAGLPAAVVNLYNKLLNGERLTPAQRAAFVKSGEDFYKETAQNLSDLNTRFTPRAKGFGVDPTGIIQTPEQYSPLDLTQAPAAGAPRKTSTGVGWSF